MSLRIHDTLRREKVMFVPRDPARVTLYVCGPTVYSYAHIGNARPVVVFDVLFRLLRHLYGEAAVVYARNITDVDDKINQAAADEGVDIGVITARFAAVYEADMAALNALPPTMQPRATAHVPQMLDMIARLVAAGHAYVSQGHVLFDVDAFPEYGALSGRSLEDMIAGARVEVAAYKRNPADFVLWKPSKPGEPVWDSAFGPGRPGWHIECSAMIEAELGLPVDIHGGGHDLIFPHHENEIAQGRCAHGGGEYARYWMHNGFLTLDAEKMSKSVGNVLRVHELVKSVPGEVVRWALLSAHYRAPLDWTEALLEQSRKALDRLYRVLDDADRALLRGGASETIEAQAVAARIRQVGAEPLLDDLNTPQAIATLFEIAGDLRQAIMAANGAEIALQRAVLLGSGTLLGVLQLSPAAWFKGGAGDELAVRVEALLTARADARKAKDWPEADRIRGELTELNIEVLDGPGSAATWRVKT